MSECKRMCVCISSVMLEKSPLDFMDFCRRWTPTQTLYIKHLHLFMCGHCGQPPLIFSDHADSCWIRKTPNQLWLVRSSSSQFHLSLLGTWLLLEVISKTKWKLRVLVAIIRFYGNSYSAIHTPKGTRVQQEIRTTHTKRNNSNYWQRFWRHFCQE